MVHDRCGNHGICRDHRALALPYSVHARHDGLVLSFMYHSVTCDVTIVMFDKLAENRNINDHLKYRK